MPNLKKEELEFIKSTYELFVSDFGLEADEDIIGDIDNKTNNFYLPFPREDEIKTDKDTFFTLFKEISTFTIHGEEKVTTDTVTQWVVNINPFHPAIYMGGFAMETNDKIHISLIEEPILIGLAATKTGNYNKFNPPCSRHLAVEVRYPNKQSRLSPEKEELLIKCFFFELAHTYNVGFEFGSFILPEEPEPEEIEQQMVSFPNILENYNYGMEIFIKANQASADDIKYLMYYTIFEFFAPIYSKLTSFEAVRKKLDSSNAQRPNAEFIASIFSLTKSYENNLRDKELIKPLINNTFDLIDIYSDLPESMIKRINKDLGNEKPTYKSKPDKLESAINLLGNILYSTRNQIVHAKSNYNLNGFECPYKDLNQLNIFMHKASYSTIKWYNRLPEHLKIDL